MSFLVQGKDMSFPITIPKYPWIQYYIKHIYINIHLSLFIFFLPNRDNDIRYDRLCKAMCGGLFLNIGRRVTRNKPTHQHSTKNNNNNNNNKGKTNEDTISHGDDDDDTHNTNATSSQGSAHFDYAYMGGSLIR